MIQNFPMVIFNSECIISFRFENLFWCLDETLINRHQAAAAASIAVRELIYHDKNTSQHFFVWKSFIFDD